MLLRSRPLGLGTPERPKIDFVRCAAAALFLGFCGFASCGCGSRTGLLVDVLDSPSVDAGAPIFPILALVPTPASGEGTYDYALSPFDPMSGAFAPLEPIPCLQAFGDRAISMAIDCSGQVYIEFERDGLWRITTSSSDCTRTPFNAAAQGLDANLALGFGANAGGGETLYYVGAPSTTSPSFGAIDPTDFQVHGIGPFGGASGADTRVCGAPDGGFFAVANGTVAAVDVSSGAVTREDQVPSGVGPTQGFAFWRGSFYLFQLLPAETTSVVRLSPGDPSPVTVGSTPWTVVAASASLCQ